MMTSIVVLLMINTQRRWSLAVILGSVILLLSGTGLFLIMRATAGGTHAASKSG